MAEIVDLRNGDRIEISLEVRALFPLSPNVHDECLPASAEPYPLLGTLAGEIGPSKWIRWGRLMGLVEAGAIRGYWPAQMVRRAGDAAWHPFFAEADREMLVKAAAAERRSHSL